MTKARETIARALDHILVSPDFADDVIEIVREAGLRIVPEEPDEGMIEAGHDRLAGEGDISDLYRAMISAYEDGK